MSEAYSIPKLTMPVARTLSEQVAAQLREAILEGRLRPGQRIVEHDIAEAMQLSRGPVRDALAILQNERLVDRQPHRGTFVALLTMSDAEEIYSLRSAIELLAVKFAIRSAKDEQLDELDHIVEMMVTEGQTQYTQSQATDLDLEFHHTLCRISGHSRAVDAWRALRPQVRLLILTHRVQQPLDFRENAGVWHSELVAALRGRDLDLASATLQRHLASSFESASQAIRRKGNKPG